MPGIPLFRSLRAKCADHVTIHDFPPAVLNGKIPGQTLRSSTKVKRIPEEKMCACSVPAF